jgi:hypothetical protein
LPAFRLGQGQVGLRASRSWHAPFYDLSSEFLT